MSSRPLVGAALAFAAGVALGGWLPQRPSLLLGAAAAVLGAWVFLLALRHDAAATAAGAAAVLLAGAAWSQADLVSLYAEGGGPPEGDAVVAGRVALTPERRGEATALVLERARLRVGGRTFAASPPVELLVDGGAGRYRIGDLLTARGRCAAVRGDRNLGWFPRPAVPRGRRRAARVYVSSPLWVRRDGRDPGTGADAAVLRWREAASRFWGRTSQPAGAILDALTTGERSSVPAAAEEAFGRAGLTHLLAISGMNVAFLAALVYLALRRLLALVEPLALRRPVHPFAAAATLPALWFFYRFSGSQIPVGRATAAIAAAMVAVILWRRIDAADGCALAVLAVLAADPGAVFSPSFQLSFAAVAALALAAPRLAAHPAEGEGSVARIRRVARGILLVSLAAGAATAPLVAFHFQQVSVVAPLANLVAVPLAGLLVLPAAWIALVAAAIHAPSGELLRAAASGLADSLVAVAGFFAAPEWASARTVRPPVLVVLALLALVAALLAPAGAGGVRRLRFAAAGAAGAALLAWRAAALAAGLRVVFLDVGQGLALAAFSPRGAVLVADAGPRWRDDDAGRRILSPALRRLGVRRIDALAVTHAHPDHAGGVPSLLREFQVGRVWMPRGAEVGADRALMAALAVLRRRGVPVEEICGGDEMRLSRSGAGGRDAGATVRALWPPREAASAPWPGGDANARSLVFLVSWGGGRLLVTGDAGAAAAEASAADAAPGRRARPLVLQAPHHGGSAEACARFAALWEPAVSVIPVGRNSYGHPSRGAVDALAASGILRRTDRDGAILVREGGAGFQVRTWRELSRGRSWGERVRWAVLGW